MDHTRIGTFFALATSTIALALAVVAFDGSTYNPAPFTPVRAAGVTVDGPLVEIPAPAVETLATVYIVAERPAKVTPRKRICDRRGNTQGMGYAVPRETVIANETVATVCWTE